MDPTVSILDPDQEVKLRNGKTVVVREMNWKSAKRFLAQLAKRSAEFVTISAKGKVDFNVDRLVHVLATDLGEALLLAATDMRQADVEALPLSEMMRLIDVAVALNLTPDMRSAGKALAERFTGLMGAGPSAKPTSGSSTSGTPAAT